MKQSYFSSIPSVNGTEMGVFYKSPAWQNDRKRQSHYSLCDHSLIKSIPQQALPSTVETHPRHFPHPKTPIPLHTERARAHTYTHTHTRLTPLESYPPVSLPVASKKCFNRKYLGCSLAKPCKATDPLSGHKKRPSATKT